jgi:hypothetical protein
LSPVDYFNAASVVFGGPTLNLGQPRIVKWTNASFVHRGHKGRRKLQLFFIRERESRVKDLFDVLSHRYAESGDQKRVVASQ